MQLTSSVKRMTEDHKPRLSRLNWLFRQDPIYFVTACTAQRLRILAEPDVHHAFLEFIQRATARNVYVGRYVQMPDHLHLFVTFGPGSQNLSDWVKSLKNSLSKTLRAQEIAAPHWQTGFFDHVLRTEESYQQKWEYVMQNPVRAGLVKSAEDWPFQGEAHALESRRA
jgi:REP element-mobilizing transposase RayT